MPSPGCQHAQRHADTGPPRMRLEEEARLAENAVALAAANRGFVERDVSGSGKGGWLVEPTRMAGRYRPAAGKAGSLDPDTVLFQQAVDRHTGYTEHTGRLSDIEAAVAQCLLDGLALGAFAGFLQIDDAGAGFGQRMRQIEVFGGDQRPLRHDRGLADPVDQFPNISGPPMKVQRLARFSTEPPGFGGRLQPSLGQEMFGEQFDVLPSLP